MSLITEGLLSRTWLHGVGKIAKSSFQQFLQNIHEGRSGEQLRNVKILQKE